MFAMSFKQGILRGAVYDPGPRTTLSFHSCTAAASAAMSSFDGGWEEEEEEEEGDEGVMAEYRTYRDHVILLIDARKAMLERDAVNDKVRLTVSSQSWWSILIHYFDDEVT